MTSVLAVPVLLTVFTGWRVVLSSQCVCKDAVLFFIATACYVMQAALLFAMPCALLYSMLFLWEEVVGESLQLHFLFSC